LTHFAGQRLRRRRCIIVVTTTIPLLRAHGYQSGGHNKRGTGVGRTPCAARFMDQLQQWHQQQQHQHQQQRRPRPSYHFGGGEYGFFGAIIAVTSSRLLRVGW